MNHSQKQTPATDAVQSLVRIANESPDNLTLDEKRQQLEKQGFDVSRLQRRLLEALEEAHGRNELASAEQKRIALSTRVKAQASAIAQKVAAAVNPREMLHGIFSGIGHPRAAVAFRKLETTSDDDLLTLLEDFEILQIINSNSDSDGSGPQNQ